MEERAGDAASSRARRRRRRAVDVADKSEGLVAAGRDDRRIVELVAAQDFARCPKRAVGRKARLAIAERHAELLEACLDAEQAGHPVLDARSVDEAFAERHKAPAFAVNGARLGEEAQAFAKPRRRRKP